MDNEQLNNSPQSELDLQELKKQIDGLYTMICEVYGTDKVVLKANKVDAIELLRSDDLGDRTLALEKIIFENPTLDKKPEPSEIKTILEILEEKVADCLARRLVEDNLDRKVNEKMQERHEEYIEEIKMQIIKENGGPENAQTLKKLALLEQKENIKLAVTAMELLRPAKLTEVVGQERAVQALISKIASPFPQHILLYGPPGVGKTSAARLALEEAKAILGSAFHQSAPFIEVDGTTLRWDPRDVTNPLLGSVHDPIYQGAKRDLADTGIPEPKLGLVTDAHGGILFIDEIGEMDPLLLNKLLKVLEDKRAYFESSYYDPDDPNIPQYIKKIFEEGAPADFILIGATTRDPGELNPALRSRCAEVFFEPLTPVIIQQIITNAAEKLGVTLDDQIPELISEYTIEGRKANNILADAYGLALYEKSKQGEAGGNKKIQITRNHVLQVVQTARLTPYVTQKASSIPRIGKMFGLGVAGFVGSVIEIEALVFSATEKGKGKLRFNETAGSMAKDSVFNASSVIRKLTNLELADFDVHINIVGGGQIDGPSAGTAISLAILSALQERPLRQDLAVTGEISIQGKVKPVGGIPEKIYGAKQAGMKMVLIPAENSKDIPVGLKGIEIIIIDSIERALEYAFND